MMQRPLRTSALGIALVAGALTLSACSGGSDGAEAETTSSPSSSEAEASPSEDASAQAQAEEAPPEDTADDAAYGDGTPFTDQLEGQELVDALKGGGYVVYIRHGKTETDYADQVKADVEDCATQRVLSREGWQQGKDIGEGFEKLGIPVGQVLASQYCRAWQTADLAFDRHEEVADLNFLPVEDPSEDDVATMKERITPLISEVPADGENIVIVAHDDPFDAATGIYPAPQGVAYVVAPKGDGDFELVANVEAQEWLELAG